MSSIETIPAIYTPPTQKAASESAAITTNPRPARAGGGTGSTSDTLSVSPDRVEIGKLYQHELSPEVTIIYRIARPE